MGRALLAGLHRRRRRRRPFSAAALGVAAGLFSLCSAAPTLGLATMHQPPPANPKAPGRLIIPHRNLPDPFVLHVGRHYYLYSSQTGFKSPPISVTVSKNDSVFSWGPTSTALATVPVWAENGFTWAPDVRFLDGRYVMYFDAWADKSIYFNASASGFSQRSQCIGIALSKSPAGPFHPVGKRPLVCQLDHHGDIDPRSFKAPSGKLYLLWKSDDNAFDPQRPTHLFAERLSADGMHLYGPTHLLMSGSRQAWEGGLIEAPQMVHAGGLFYLFFSGSWFNGPTYAIGFALCKSVVGPCHQLARSQLLKHTPQGSGPGEESLFENGAGWWMVYSPWSLSTHDYRPVSLARIGFNELGPYLARVG